MMQVDEKGISALASVVAFVNIAFLAGNAWLSLNLKLAISSLELRVERNRREDAQDMRKYIDDRFERKFL